MWIVVAGVVGWQDIDNADIRMQIVDIVRQDIVRYSKVQSDIVSYSKIVKCR